ncbi:autotransporter outer membrane beta-barrel domain-containing protein [Salmonella enterica]|nr:autotransporter outer membrane beta-barrel domain-containing protein [Salmonella enterica]
MAVENKFKLNVLAASVLMGLSLSAVAAVPATADKPVDSKATTTPAKPKTLGESAAAASATTDADGKKTGVAAEVSAEKIEVTSNSTKSTLGALLKSTLGVGLGSTDTDNSKKKAYDDAVEKYNKLTSEERTVADDYAQKKAKFDAAGSAFTDSDFAAKAAGVNKIYDEKLEALYGKNGESAGHSWVITPDATPSSASIKLNDDGKEADKKTPSLFNDYVKSITTASTGLNAALKELEVRALVVADGSAVETKAAKASVDAYMAYLKAYNDVAQAEAKQVAVEHYIQEKLPAFLKVVEANKKADGNTSSNSITNATKLDGLYTAFTKAVDDYKSAKENEKAAKKKAVYANLDALVTESVKTGVLRDTPKGFSATDFQTALHSANALWNTLDDSLNKATIGLKAVLETDATPDSADLPDGVKNQKIANQAAALRGLKTYMDKLIALANKRDASNVGLVAALKNASTAYGNFQQKQAAYQAALNELKTVESQRTGLLGDWVTLNTVYTEAADAYNLANTKYQGSSAEKAVTALDEAKTSYAKELGDVSSGINAALGSVSQTYIKAVQAGDTATTQEAKNTALYTLIGQQKALTSAKLEVDTALLGLRQGDLKAKTDAIAKAESDKAEAENQYKAAVAEYRTATDRLNTDTDKTHLVANEVAVATAEAKLKAFTKAGDLSELYVIGSDAKNGFKLFKDLDPTKVPALKTLSEAQDKLYMVGTEANPISGTKGSDIQKARLAVVDSLSKLSSLMPLSTADEQKKFRQQYNESLASLRETVTGADAQSKLANAESITHYLGSLSKEQTTAFNTASGQFNSVIVNVDDKGNITGVKDNFTGKDLYTGTKDKPFITTVLDISALELGNGALADTNTITVGEAGSKDKKATPVEVWAKTAGVKHSGDENSQYVSAEHGPAVKLSGDLRTATAQLDENGKPVDGQIVRGADQIHLQNVNIHNSFTLADRTKMLADDMAAINSEAADKLNLGQPADGEKGVNAWQKAQTDLLHSKYDKLQLTGLQIDTTTVNPSFDLSSGDWKNAGKTVIPTEANILLDNLNITLQNDSVGGTSTAIDLSGTGNHILANGGVFDAGNANNLTQADVLNITGKNNRVDFMGSTLKGDINSTAAGNTVNLTNGSLTGNAIAGTGNLTLNLDSSAWTGRAGPNSPNISLSNNSVWNVAGYSSSVNSLALNGSNTLNLGHADGQAQLGGRGFVGSKYGTVLRVDHDLVSDGKGVTSVLAGTYTPGNAHSLTNTGLADGYQSGTLNVNGLATGGKYALSVESSGAEPYTIGGRLADGPGATSAHDFVSYKTSESRVVTGKDGKPVTQTVTSDADFTSLSAPAEMGVYQYAAEKVIDAVNNRTNIYYSSTGKLSSSAATVVSLAAAPVDVANLQSDTLAKHMNSVRHGKDSGVWVSYFGGENRNTTAAGPEYTLKTNGVMLGADTLTENNWLAGVAVSSARSDMSVMNSSGDLNSYGAQFYMSRRYDSGVFVDSALQFNHFSNTAKARMINGQQAKADFSGNSYGLEAKVGYAWNSEGFFAEPYVRAAARAFDGEHYALSNGMTVNSNDYKSMLGEVGADLGYQYAISGGYVKPYLHLAALNEFADGNSVRVNNVSLDNSVKGSAFQAGLGAEVKVTDNLGGYAAFDYTKGENTERPWQATVGVNYTW